LVAVLVPVRFLDACPGNPIDYRLDVLG